jgi:hypothetical protein
VPLQQVAKPPDRRLVGQSRGGTTEPGELQVQRNVVQRFFHRRVRQAESLLHVVDAQHGLNAEGRATPSCPWGNAAPTTCMAALRAARTPTAVAQGQGC